MNRGQEVVLEYRGRLEMGQNLERSQRGTVRRIRDPSAGAVPAPAKEPGAFPIECRGGIARLDQPPGSEQRRLGGDAVLEPADEILDFRSPHIGSGELQWHSPAEARLGGEEPRARLRPVPLEQLDRAAEHP